ncbi:uncharacterized protein LOC122813738 isoform X2 [Protopterus annectens]|nr:uncharacterized protein LOC122813738 isoform X2 [Protopterus annectens]XP_043942146.1 uncharacterized protein LOC122813738 isoform X2 [Protopterus annectens]XP_043942147.1 uncharacterized protein LOC122813738 isoform X2 [Protopterus annectens]
MDSITMSCTLTSHQNRTQIQDVSIKWKRMHKNGIPASYNNDKYVLPEEFQGRAYVRWFQHNLTSIFHICDLLVSDTDVYKCQITFRVSDHLETAEGNGSSLTVTDFVSTKENASTTNSTVPTTQSTMWAPQNLVLYIMICFGAIIIGSLTCICKEMKEGSNKLISQTQNHTDQASFIEEDNQVTYSNIQTENNPINFSSNSIAVAMNTELYSVIKKSPE